MNDVNTIINGNCFEVLKTFPDNFFDSCVTDPPYGISFMNKHWDYDVPKVEVWAEIIRVLKPGAHILVACGTRTQHRMAVNIEDAGFEIRDVITWHYGSGFPKSLDISKSIDKQAGVEREVVGSKITGGIKRPPSALVSSDDYDENRRNNYQSGQTEVDVTAPKTDEAKQWEGWGTALKPATEFWTLARKPLSENTIAENVLKHGTGGINIDGSRIGLQEGDDPRLGGNGRWKTDKGAKNVYEGGYEGKDISSYELGRFPANLILDDEAGKILDIQSGLTSSSSNIGNPTKPSESIGTFKTKERMRVPAPDDFGGASRFFYCPKADNFERNKGLNGFEQVNCGMMEDDNYPIKTGSGNLRETKRQNYHPTVKPIDLMRYLVKLITPKHGICLDPYCGSGTTLIGCKLELINYIGIDMVEEYCKISEARVAAWNPPKYIEQTLF